VARELAVEGARTGAVYPVGLSFAYHLRQPQAYRLFRRIVLRLRAKGEIARSVRVPPAK
jgi:hypothetical protein